MKKLCIMVFATFSLNGISQCESFQFSDLGYEPAKCRTTSTQSGNAIVYAAATGGTPSYSYLWTNLQTGSSSTNTVWAGLNAGLYKIQVTDQIGCILIDTIEVDSIIPTAIFTITSPDLDGSLTGIAPVNAEFQSISEPEMPWFVDFGDPSLMSWKLGNDNPYEATWQYHEQVYATFNSESVQEVCLAISNTNGCKDTSCQYITVQGFATTEEYLMDTEELNFYPNPVSDYLTVQMNISIDWIEIVDLSGRTILKLTKENTELIDIYVGNLSPGIYTLICHTETKIFSEQFIKQE